MAKSKMLNIPVTETKLIKLLSQQLSYALEDSEELYDFFDKAIVQALDNMWKRQDPRLVGIVEKEALRSASKKVEVSGEYLLDDEQITRAIDRFKTELRKGAK
jgi:hypothetical protein